MMYAYVTCRPDIGYAITTMSKFSTTPTLLHYQYLKHVAKYLQATKHWGIRYKRSTIREDLPPAEFDRVFAQLKMLPMIYLTFLLTSIKRNCFVLLTLPMQMICESADQLLDSFSHTVEVISSTDQRPKASMR